tara:strand:+ start:184 stop:1239 length:1056 start_codon:yes stop_codon:yes gene_type:complete
VNINNQSVLAVVLLAGLSVLLPAHAAVTLPATLERPSQHDPLAEHSMLSAMTRAGDRLLAAGEGGHILYSDDMGQHWQQAEVPVSVTLTAICFATADVGWAVGHRGVVLKSADGGKSWVRQLEGNALAQLFVDPTRGTDLEGSVEGLVRDGADKPLLDVSCLDDQHVVAVGAYGLGVTTADGGRRWQPAVQLLNTSMEMHINAALAQPQQLLLAGEMGGLYVASRDLQQVTALDQPYDGSFFGMIQDKAGDLFAYGLRGHLFRSSDGGKRWVDVSPPTQQSLTAAAQLDDGSLLFTDAFGLGWYTTDSGNSFRRVQAQHSFPFTAMLPLDDGSVLASGMNGFTRFLPDQFN